MTLTLDQFQLQDVLILNDDQTLAIKGGDAGFIVSDDLNGL